MTRSGRMRQAVFLTAVSLASFLLGTQLHLATSFAFDAQPGLSLEVLLGALLSSATSTGRNSSNNITSRLPGNPDGGLVMDIVSIGSKMRLDFQQAQAATFGRHRSVRYFFNITEANDADPTCSETLSSEDAYGIANHCRSRNYSKQQFLLGYLHNHYARAQWLAKKVNPAGWMCAQTRPSHGLHTAVTHYRRLLQASAASQGKASSWRTVLPDYLVVTDDDTYMNLELVTHYLSSSAFADDPQPRAIAGCMIRSPIHEINFTIPYGGFGMIFNQAALWNYMRPVHCPAAPLDDFSASACRRVANNQIGEGPLFQNGMSISDLQQAYASAQPYTHYRNWTTGFCFHSDWLWGFFSNFYNISKHNDDAYYHDVPHARMEGYNQSELYAGRATKENKAMRRICDNAKTHCDASSPICHYQTPADMERLTAEVQTMFPDKFLMKGY